MKKTAPARVLVVEDDLNIHKVIHDILEINFKSVKIDRVTNFEMFLSKIRKGQEKYDLILYDLHFDDPTAKDALPVIRREMPELDSKIVLLIDSLGDIQENPGTQGLSYILKPFSLDTFRDVVKKVCASR